MICSSALGGRDLYLYCPARQSGGRSRSCGLHERNAAKHARWIARSVEMQAVDASNNCRARKHEDASENRPKRTWRGASRHWESRLSGPRGSHDVRMKASSCESTTTRSSWLNGVSATAPNGGHSGSVSAEGRSGVGPSSLVRAPKLGRSDGARPHLMWSRAPESSTVRRR